MPGMYHHYDASKYQPWKPSPEKEVLQRDRQIGGDHYKNLAIQPGEYITKNNLNWYEGNVIKYVTRHRYKNGREDIEKAIHYLQLLLEQEYGV